MLQKFPCRFEKKGVLFIMLDESRPNSGSRSNGYFKPNELAQVKQWIAEAGAKKVILVAHYPLRDKLGHGLSHRRSLENGDLLYELLENGQIDINLCGHIHAAFVRQEASGSREICAGSLTIGGRLNKLEFDEEKKIFKHSWIEV